MATPEALLGAPTAAPEAVVLGLGNGVGLSDVAVSVRLGVGVSVGGNGLKMGAFEPEILLRVMYSTTSANASNEITAMAIVPSVIFRV